MSVIRKPIRLYDGYFYPQKPQTTPLGVAKKDRVNPTPSAIVDEQPSPLAQNMKIGSQALLNWNMAIHSRATAESRKLRFVYAGGSNPGTARTVTPLSHAMGYLFMAKTEDDQIRQYILAKCGAMTLV